MSGLHDISHCMLQPQDVRAMVDQSILSARRNEGHLKLFTASIRIGLSWSDVLLTRVLTRTEAGWFVAAEIGIQASPREF